MMPESEVLTRMGIKGMDAAIDAVSDLLTSIGYHDTARDLRLRWDAEAPTDDEVPW